MGSGVNKKKKKKDVQIKIFLKQLYQSTETQKNIGSFIRLKCEQ